MVYTWSIPKYSVSADVAGMEFERIEREHGEVSAEVVLDEARPEDAVLHNEFEWDNLKAAEKFRLNQAKSMIRALIVSSEDTNNRPMRAFVDTTPDTKKASYISIGTAIRDEELRKVVLGNAMREMQIFKAKYSNYKELAKVMAAMDAVLEDAS